MQEPARSFLRALFNAAVEAAAPAICLPPFLPDPPAGRTIVIGAGKAAAEMARAVETHWPRDKSLDGLVITRYGHAVPCNRIEVVEAGHPLPDEAGRRAGQRILDLVTGLSADDLVLCLLSGGGSALMEVPLPGVTLEDQRGLTEALLRSGARIGEINSVRKHLSALKGGRLAAAASPAWVLTLAISDVPGDDPSVIASGPTVADPSTQGDAIAVLAKYKIDTPSAIASVLADPTFESPKPGDSRLSGGLFRTIASALTAMDAAAVTARTLGTKAMILGSDIQGEARAIAGADFALAQHIFTSGEPITAPAVLISGGEATVTVRGTGRGGPNTEYLLALAILLDGRSGVYALAADTDGIDGTEDNAGAFIEPGTLDRARALGLDPQAYLDNNDAYAFFAALDDLIITGPTRTNVNDFRAILID